MNRHPQSQPAIRLTGVLTTADVTNDGVDVILHAAIRVGEAAGSPIYCEVTMAVAEEDVPALRDALKQEWAQIGATSSAIDDHDEAVMRRAS